MMTGPNNRRTRILAQTAALLFVIATGAVLFLTLSERTTNINVNALRRTSLRCPRQTIEQRIAEADLILTATVFAVVPKNGEANVLLTSQRVYKGNIPENGIVVAARAADRTSSSGVLGDLHFTSSDPPYLLFLKQRDNNLFTTSVCFGSRLLGDELTQDERALLGKGT